MVAYRGYRAQILCHAYATRTSSVLDMEVSQQQMIFAVLLFVESSLLDALEDIIYEPIIQRFIMPSLEQIKMPQVQGAVKICKM